MSGYADFARFYDKLTFNVDYSGIADAVDRYVEKFGGRKGTLLDLACGTGTLSELLAKRGYDVIGAEASVEMLNAAYQKRCENGSNVMYVCQQMTEIEMYGTMDVTVCNLDSINHLESLDDVQKTFDKVSFFAEAGGLFIFDVNTLYKHKYILVDNAFVYEVEGLFCIWQNSFNEADGSVDIMLDFFEDMGNDSYRRSCESFVEYYYSPEDIEKCLQKSGFELLARYDGYTFNEPSGETQRVVYVARRE